MVHREKRRSQRKRDQLARGDTEFTLKEVEGIGGRLRSYRLHPAKVLPARRHGRIFHMSVAHSLAWLENPPLHPLDLRDLDIKSNTSSLSLLRVPLFRLNDNF